MTTFEALHTEALPTEARPATTPELPVHLTHFVGRDQELAELTRLVPSARLLTLTGAGGSGKTRLARELALRCGGRFGRIGWVDLAPISDARLVAQEIARARCTSRIAPVRRRATSLIGAICEIARSLIVLDNCEHLVDACADARRGAAAQPARRLAILATSREALGVASETAWLVPPLGERPKRCSCSSNARRRRCRRSR